MLRQKKRLAKLLRLLPQPASELLLLKKEAKLFHPEVFSVHYIIFSLRKSEDEDKNERKVTKLFSAFFSSHIPKGWC
jgi:hypothetical protein